MQLETIEELANILSASPLARLELETEGWSLQLERPAPPPVAPLAAPGTASTPAPSAPGVEAASAEPETVAVDAPIVGVFHDAANAVTVGQTVRAGDILGAIEALALRNEIRSPVDGPVVAVSVEDGQPVEYGQPLFTLGRPEEAA